MSSTRCLFLVEMPPDGFSGFARNNGSQGFRGGLLDIAQTPKVREKALAGLRAYAGNVQQFGVAVAHGAALAMIADREAMTFVANQLDKVEHRRPAVQNNRLVPATPP